MTNKNGRPRIYDEPMKVMRVPQSITRSEIAAIPYIKNLIATYEQEMKDIVEASDKGVLSPRYERCKQLVDEIKLALYYDWEG